MTDLDRQPCLVGQALQLDLPQARTIAVGATADCGDLQRAGVLVALPAEVLPPTADRVDRKLGRVMVDADLHPALFGRQVKDAIGNRLAVPLVLEVVHPDRLG